MADPTPSPAPAGDPTPPAPPSDGGDPPPPAPPADPPAPTGTKTPAGDPMPADPPAEGLAEGGKKALQSEREARKAAEKELKTLKSELDELRKAQMSDHERAVAEARQAGETETEAKFRRHLFAAGAQVAAAGKLADPTLLADPDVAQRLLGFKEIPVDAAGDIDPEAISEAIDRLIEGRPFLKAGQQQANATWPSNGSEAGPRGDAKSQLTRDDLKRMSPQEIVKARAEGRLTNLLGPPRK